MNLTEITDKDTEFKGDYIDNVHKYIYVIHILIYLYM